MVDLNHALIYFIALHTDVNFCIPIVGNSCDSFLDSPIQLCEFQKVIRRLKSGTSAGLDGISYEFFQNLDSGLINFFLIYFNLIFRGFISPPLDWFNIKLTTYFKKV